MCYLFEFSGDFSHIIIIVTEKKSDNNDDDDTISYQNEIYFFLVHVETTQSYNMYTLNDEYGFFLFLFFVRPLFLCHYIIRSLANRDIDVIRDDNDEMK